MTVNFCLHLSESSSSKQKGCTMPRAGQYYFIRRLSEVSGGVRAHLGGEKFTACRVFSPSTVTSGDVHGHVGLHRATNKNPSSCSSSSVGKCPPPHCILINISLTVDEETQNDSVSFNVTTKCPLIEGYIGQLLTPPLHCVNIVWRKQI